MDSTCVPIHTECSQSGSVSQTVACPDGSCVDYPSQCPTYNGCGLDKPIQCASGKCVDNETECECPGLNGFVRCFDGTCVSPNATCPNVPYQQKPISFVFTVDVTQSNSININSQDENGEVICTISYESDTFDFDGLFTIEVNSVADSVLRQTSVGSSDPLPIYSPVIDLSIPLDFSVPQPFRRDISITCDIVIPEDVDASKLCLAYFKSGETDWTCTNQGPTVQHLVFTGKTNHFTSFACLVGDSASTSSTSSNSGSNSVLIAAVVTIVVFFVIAVIFVISVVLYKNRQRRLSRASLTIRMEEYHKTLGSKDSEEEGHNK